LPIGVANAAPKKYLLCPEWHGIFWETLWVKPENKRHVGQPEISPSKPSRKGDKNLPVWGRITLVSFVIWLGCGLLIDWSDRLFWLGPAETKVLMFSLMFFTVASSVLTAVHDRRYLWFCLTILIFFFLLIFLSEISQ
jgi:hypothetical protein